MEAYIDIDSNGAYLVFLSLLFMTFAPIKLRSIYHNFRFMQFSAEKKKEKLLAMNDFEDVSKQSSLRGENAIDDLIMGTGPIEFQRMSQDSSNFNDVNDNENDMESNFSNQTESADDMLGISSVKNLSEKRRNEAQLRQVNENSSFGAVKVGNYSNNNNNDNINQININTSYNIETMDNRNSYSNYSNHSGTIINLNDVKLGNSMHSSLNSHQSSVSGLSTASNSERIGGYVPRLDEQMNNNNNELSTSSLGRDSNSRPRTLSEKHPGFVAIK